MYTDSPDAMFVETQRMPSVENLLMRDYQVALWISLDEQLLSHVLKKVVSWLWRMCGFHDCLV